MGPEGRAPRGRGNLPGPACEFLMNGRRFTLRRRGDRWVLLGAMMLSALLWAGAAGAFIREGAIEGRPGFSFRRLTFYWKHLDVDIVNGTNRNAIFGGSMVFLDRHHTPVAKAELLPESIKRRSSRHYRASFTRGSGEEASRAAHLVWVFDQRNN